MKRLFIAMLWLLACFSSFSQKSPISFGNASAEEVKMSVYPLDSSASAVVIKDFGESEIKYSQNNGFSILFERTLRIKILTKQGLDHANFEIPVYHSGASSEDVSSIKGITYNLENGKIVETKLKNDGIFKEVFDDNYDIIKITMPNVKEGSVIDLSYKISSDFLFNFQDWQFQNTIPVVYSEYRANIPEYFEYSKYMQGYITLSVNEHTTASKTIILNYKERSGGFGFTPTSTSFSNEQIQYTQHNYRWVAENVPAFKSEPFITTPQDYISKMNFELAFIKMPNQPIKPIMGSWDELNKKFSDDESFGKEVTGNAFLKKEVETLISGLEKEDEKINAIVNYIKQNVTWDGRYRKYSSGQLKKVLQEKKGSSADINLLLCSMLDKANIKVNPVLISTRNHGFLRDNLPISSQFNYVICLAQVGDKQILLDATEKLLPNNMLPSRCLNGKGFVVSPETFSWVGLETKLKTKSMVSGNLSLAEDALIGSLKVDNIGYNALEKRKDYFKNGKDEFIKNTTRNKSWDVQKIDVNNPEDIQSNFTEVYDLSINENVTSSGDILYIDPFIESRIKSNPFKSPNRDYPVDFGYPNEETYFLKLNIPEGYEIEELPVSKILSLPESAGKFIFNVSQTSNLITITSIVAINRSLFSQVDYEALREFYNQVVSKQAEQIVLKRKG